MARKRNASKLLVASRYETDRRAIVGVRVSEGRERGHTRISEDVQLKSNTKLAEHQNLTVVHTYMEIGISGDAERQALEHAIVMIEKGQAAWLVVSEVDRLGRDFMDIADTMERINRAGGCLLIGEPLLRSYDESAQLLITILGQLAQAQRMKIAKKWNTAQAHAWERGVYPGDIPAGYRNPKPHEVDPERNHPQLQVVEGDAALIRNVARAIVDDGISWPIAARRLDRSANSTRALYGNRVLLGEVRFGDMFKRDAHEAILTVSDFEAINNRRTTSVTARANDAKHLGAGTLRCAGCRMTLHHRTSGVGARTYYCRTAWCEQPVKNLDASETETLLKGLALEAQGELEGLVFEGSAVDGRTIGDVDHDLQNARAKVLSFLAMVDEDPDDEDAKAMWRKARAAVKALEDERTALKAAQSGLRMALMADEVWEATDARGRIEAIRSVLDCVFVFPGGAMHPFTFGTYTEPLPSKGRSVTRAPYVPTQVRV